MARLEFKLDGIPDHVTALAREIQARGGQLWIVGGWVRDRCSNRQPKDLDLVCFALDAPRLDELLRARGGLQVVGRAFPVRKWMARGLVHDIQIAPPGTELLEEAQARDLRINALYCDPITALVHDPLGGLEDLASRRLRIVGSSFSNDPVRKLRLVRACIAFDAEAEEEAWERARSMQLEKVARERITDELRAILTAPYSLRRLPPLWARIGLGQDWPELAEDLRSSAPTPWGDALDRLAADLRESSENFLELLCYLAARIADEPSRLVWLTRILDESRAADAWERVAEEQRLTETMQAWRDGAGVPLEFDASLVRSYRKRGSLAALAARSEALAIAKGCPADLAQRIRCLTLDRPKIDAWITGRELHAVGIKPGPEFGALLDRALVLQLRGDFEHRAAAVAWLQSVHKEQ